MCVCHGLKSSFTDRCVEQELGESGKPGFYRGRVAQAVVDVVRQNGGVMTLEDLSGHDSEVVAPVSTDYKVWLPKRRFAVPQIPMASARV